MARKGSKKQRGPVIRNGEIVSGDSDGGGSSSSLGGPVEQIREDSDDDNGTGIISFDNDAHSGNHIVALDQSGKDFDIFADDGEAMFDSKMRPRQKLLNTLLYFASYFLIGIVMASIGPAVIMIAKNTNSSEDEVAFAFPVRCLGGIFGAMSGGFFIERIKSNLLTALTLLLCALGMFLLPFCTNILSLVTTVAVGGFTMGMLDSAGNVAMMWLHDENSGPYIQCLHFMFGVGATLAPLLEIWFTAGSDASKIKYAFWLSAAAFVPVALFLLVLPSPSRPSSHLARSAAAGGGSSSSGGGGGGAGDKSKSKKKEPAIVYSRREWIITFLGAALLMLDVGAEIAYGGFIFLYGVRMLDMNPMVAAELTALFWGALALGRFLAIFISRRWSPEMMMFVNLAGCFLSSILITFDFTSAPLLFAATFFYGLAQASVFPTIISLTESFLVMTGSTASLLVFGASIGEMIVPLILSRLFAQNSKHVLVWLVWILVIISILSLVALGIMVLLGWRNREIQGLGDGDSMVATPPLELELGKMAISSTAGKKENPNFTLDHDEDLEIL